MVNILLRYMVSQCIEVIMPICSISAIKNFNTTKYHDVVVNYGDV